MLMNRLVFVLPLLALGLNTFAQETPRVRIKRQYKAIYHKQDSLYRERIRKVNLDGRYIPKDLNDCFIQLDKLMDEDSKARFMKFSDKEVDRKTHRTLGKWIEVNWSLVEGSRLSHYFNKMKVPHYDYMIGIIIQSYHRKLHKRPIDLKAQVLKFREMWAAKQEKKAREMLESGKKQE